MIDYAAVLTRKHAGREWQLNGDEYEGLVMLDGGPKPSKAVLDAAWPEVRDQIKAEQTAREQARVSALAKLAALGLNESEIAALLGA